jgi:ABC-type polysaccharide/polyol phosphate export permease
MAAVSGAFIGFFFNLIVFLAFALLDGVDWSLRMLWFIPLVIALYLLVVGIGLMLSIVVVKVRDTLSLWEVVTQLGFWFTPVMYPMSNVPEKFRFYEFLNPMSGILEYSRYVVIGLGGLSKLGYCYVLGVSLLVFFLGIAVFKCKEAEMVEDL